MSIEETPADRVPVPVPELRVLLADRSVVALLVMAFASTAAMLSQATVIGWQVVSTTGRSLDLGLVGLAEFVPSVLLVVVTGWVADRVDRRLVVGLSLLAEMLCTVALAIHATRGDSGIGVILVVVAVFGAARSFGFPAGRAIKPLVAPPGTLPRLVALYSVMWQSAIVVGPLLGGLLIRYSLAAAYLGNLVLLAIAAIAISLVRYRTAPDRITERPNLRDAFEGLRVIRRERVLLGAISLDLMAVLFGGAVALLPALARSRLDVGSEGLGLLRAAGGIGAGAMALLLTFRPVRRRVGRTLLVAVAVFGVFTIVLGLTEQLWIAFAAALGLAAADAISVFIRATLVPLATHDAVRGRVMAVEAVFIGASNELGAFESGVTAEWFGLVPAIVFGGVMCILVAVVWWFRFPALRDVDRFEDVIREDAP